MAMTAKSSDNELDLASLTRTLGQLNEEVHSSRVGVLDAVRSRGAEFSAASDQVNQLQRRVTDLNRDLGISEKPLPPLPPLPALALEAGGVQRESEKHGELSVQLSEVDDAIEILAALLETRKGLLGVEGLLAKCRFTEAADLLQIVAASLAQVSAPMGAEPKMIQSVKAEYCTLRHRLVSAIDARFHELIGLGPSEGVARQGRSQGSSEGTTLPEVWSLFQVLGLRNRRLDHFSLEIKQKLLRPLLAAGSRLPPGRRLTLNSDFSDGMSFASFAWKEEDFDQNDDFRDLAQGRPQAAAVLGPLEDLLEKQVLHWAGALPEVYAALGSRLYFPLARQLLSQFEVYELDGGHAVQQFESRLQSRGFIRSSESPLWRHVHHLRFAKEEASRASVLVQAKTWLQEPAELVHVDDAAFHDVMRLGKWSGTTSQGKSQVQSKLDLDQDSGLGLLHLPSMKVSSVLLRLVRCILTSMEAAQDARDDSSRKETLDLVRRLCVLFALVRPHVHQLKVDAKLCSIFMADLLCLAHILILLPSWPMPDPPFALDLVPQLRQLGERHFGAMLRHHKDQLLSALRPCNLGRGAAEGAAYIATEAALGAAAQQLKVFCSGVSALPAQILQESVLLLLGVFCKELVRMHLEAAEAAEPLSKASKPKELKVDLAAGVGRVVGVGGRLLETFAGAAGVGGSGDDFREVLAGLKGDPRVPDPSPTEVWVLDGEDVSSVISLLTSAQAMVRQCLQATSLASAAGVEDQVPGYPVLQIVADLLGSDFSRFLQSRKRILKAMQRDEVIRLMKLSWQDEALTMEEAWRVLTAG